MRSVAPQAQFVRAYRLHDVLEDRGALQHPPGAARRPREVGIGRDLRVEAGEILIEPEHVRDSCDHILLRAHTGRRTQDLDGRVPAPSFADPNTPGLSGADAERHLEGASRLVEPRRRELRESVRVHRSPQVDWLSTVPGEPNFDARGHDAGACRSRKARTLLRFPQLCIEHHLAEWFFERS